MFRVGLCWLVLSSKRWPKRQPWPRVHVRQWMRGGRPRRCLMNRCINLRQERVGQAGAVAVGVPSILPLAVR